MENTITGFKISSQQKSLYLLQSNNPDFQYISHCTISIHGHLETAVLKSAIENVIKRHEILRTEFPCLPGMNLPVQVINDVVNLSIEESDLTNLDTAIQVQEISERLKNANSVNFDLAQSPLYQISIIHLSDVEHKLIINVSSLCADTVSLKNIFQEISNYYSNYIHGINTDAAEEVLQYADFCEYQHQAIAEGEAELANIKAYWQQDHINPLFNLRLPGEKLHSNQSDFRPQILNWQVDKILQQQIEDVAKKHNTNISQILLTCWYILLSRLTGRNELVIGYNYDGRNYEELDLAIGLFSKTLPIHFVLEKNHTFTEILSEVNKSTELCQNWQDAFDWEKVFSNSGSCPFSFEFTEINSIDNQNSEFSLTQVYSYVDKFKLKLAGLLTTDGLKLVLHYDSNLFTEAQIQICQKHLEKLLENTLRFPEKAIRELDIINDIEHQQLRELNYHQNNSPQNKCFHQIFAERAEKTPDEIAIVYQNQQLTYREINQRANQLAHYFQKLGVTSEVLVGLCLERSLETVIGILGILKAGGAYVPLDPKYPQERIAFIVEETKLSILLTQENLVSKLPKLDAELVCIDTDLEKIAQESPENPSSQTTLQHLAYVIYTSGSTGKPKGVQIPHGNISDYVQAMSQAFQLESKDTYLHTASFSFSSSVRQLMVPLSQGATVVIAAIEQIQTPLVLFELIQQRQITIIDLVPSYWRSCTELLESLSTEERNNILDNQLRLILSASEPLLSDIPKKWRFDFKQDVTFINMYGQTETTGIVCVYPIPDEYEDKVTIVPIGRPIATTEVYLLDEDFSPVPVGEIGEIYISGSSLARSYFNRPDLTDEKFIPNPFSDSYGALRYRPARLYKAGDLARCLPDGTIKFIGRSDYQVKIRGQRVELGEIESIIALYPGVKQTIVMGRDVSGDQQLVAYIVPKLVSNEETSQTVSIKQLRTYLTEKLPEYMVPSTFLILPAFPLTPTGKIDRRALPAPENLREQVEEAFVAPHNELEEKLAKIWEQVLGITPIGIKDNFFELGGHSLLSLQIISRIKATLNVDISVTNLLTAPTIELLGQVITELKNNHQTINQVQKPEIITQLNRTSEVLSFAQRRLWFLHKIDPQRTDYHIHRVLKITGEINISILQKSLDTIVEYHQILRTQYHEENGELIQIISALHPVELKVIDVQNLELKAITQILEVEKNRTFNLAIDLMLRSSLLQIGKNEYLLLLVIHHIASDGWSMGILQENLTQLYTAFIQELPNPLTPLKVQYADFAKWERQWLTGEELANQINYWQEKLKDKEQRLELPTDYLRPLVQNNQGASQVLTLDSQLTKAIKLFSQQKGVTLYVTLLTAFSIILHRYSGQDSFIIGSPFAGRKQTEIESLIGFFINTVMLGMDLENNPKFSQLLNQNNQIVLDALNYQETPFEKIVEAINPQRDLSRNPLFQVLFNMLSFNEEILKLPGLTLEEYQDSKTKSIFDLTLYVKEKQQEIELEIVYQTSLFKSERIWEMLQQYEQLLNQIVVAPDKSINSYSLVTSDSRTDLPNPAQPLDQPDYQPITNIFSDWAKRTPQQPAIIQNQQTWNYQELDQASTAISSILSTKIQKGEVVSVSGKRSFGLIASMLAVLKSGGVLLNIDPNLPSSRKELMLSISQAKTLLFVGEEKDNWENSLETIYIAEKTGKTSLAIPENPSIVEISPEDSAYIFFTSGTTGTPKGVLGVHKGLSHFLNWQKETFNVNPEDKVAQLTGLSFDVVLRDIFLPLTSGATVCLPEEDSNLSALQVLPWLEKNQITLMHTVPTILQSWLMNVPPGIFLKHLRLLFSAGEPLTDTLIRQWRKAFPTSGQIVNLYGPTETTLAKCYYIVPENPLPRVQSVGSPLPQTQCLILSKENQLCGIGESGEIVFRTPFTTKGYINADSKQSSKFVKNPWRNDDKDLIYYTGDKGRYRLDGTIEILGRIDQQLKIRGVRIEPGEISATINQNPLIKASVVIAREDVPGDKCLVAYVVPNSQDLNISELRQFLKQRLPDYMIPSAFLTLEALPVTANGKIDKRALPAPNKDQQQLEKTFVAPRNDIEKQLIAIWEKILGVQPISVTDNFFELGGHSLLALRLLSEIEKGLGKSLTLAALFTGQTVEELALVLGSQEKSHSSSSLVPIQTAGKKPPLFVIHAIWGNILFYRELVSYLPSDQPVYGLQAKGLDGKETPITSVTEMAAYYIQEMRTVQPHGPYFIGGHSLGAIVAFEMAQQLHSQGEKIAMLAIFDMSAPQLYDSNLSASNPILSKLHHLLNLKPADQLNYLLPRIQWHLTVGKASVFYKLYLRYIKRSLPSLRVINVAAANKQAQKSYMASSVYPGTLTLFRAVDDQSENFNQDRESGWGQITHKVEIYEVPGIHSTVMQEPNVRVMAEKLIICLKEKQNEESKTVNFKIICNLYKGEINK